MTSTYLAGELPTLVTGDGIVVAAADRLAEVAALLGRPLEPLTVVEVLSRGVLTDVPDFAAARRDGDQVHVLVRGAFSVLIDGVPIDGRDATTWAEASARVGPGSAVQVLAPGTTSGTAPGGLALPLADGVVRSAGLTWHPVPAPAATPTPVGPAEDRTVARAAGAPAAPAAPAALPPPFLPPALPRHQPPAPPPYRPPAAPPAPVPNPSWQPGEDADHDGRTITPAQLQALRASQAPATPATPSAPSGPSVPAPPPVRPRVALELSTGRVVPVRRRVLLGRNPRVQQVGGSANLPALVTVDDPYVSSTHLEVAADGSRITVTDMSTNGTLLSRRGGVPFPLEHGVATEIAVGDVLTLSKGLTATVTPAPAPAPAPLPAPGPER